MSFNKQTIKRLEREISEFSPKYLIIPIMASPEEAEAIRQEAKRRGIKTLGIPLEDFKQREKLTTEENYEN